jgi:nicotinate-nucleotide--dimethylbenzimidazole phosphoribosyltransferase
MTTITAPRPTSNAVPEPLAQRIARIPAVDPAVAVATQHLLDGKTKPQGSLGRLEELTCRVASIRGQVRPAPLGCAVVVMAADHGVAAEGVSAFPSAVTRQMVLNFAHGGAAINVLARQVGAEVVVVDMGVAESVDHPAVRSCRVGAGTENFTQGAAMTLAQALSAIEHGALLADELAARGVGAVGLGEMGIGNTTSATALVAGLTGALTTAGGAGLDGLVGRGTGIDDAAWAKKRSAVARGLALHGWGPPLGPPGAEPLDHDVPGAAGHGPHLTAGVGVAPAAALRLLAAVGGFELAGLVGLTLGAAAHRVVVVVDGFITTAAALVAVGLAPLVKGYLVASHRSVEPGHGVALAMLGASPLLDLELRLGEGTGAALALGLMNSGLALLRDMATFQSAGVSSRAEQR